MTVNLRGIELRYALTLQLVQHGPQTVDELIEALEYHGFAIPGRASKSVSDALRWEIARGRVRRIKRGRYGPGRLPRGTDHPIHRRVMALREKAAALGGDEEFWDALL